MTAGERAGAGGGVSLWTWGAERDAAVEPGGDGVGVGDGARVGLGLVAFTALGRVGQTGCEGTEWESETSVRCLVGQGSGDSAGGDDGGGAGRERQRMDSVDVGSMSVTRRSNRAGTGSASVTVHGSGWGWWRSRRWVGWGRRDARGRSGSRRRRCGAWWGTGHGARVGWR